MSEEMETRIALINQINKTLELELKAYELKRVHKRYESGLKTSHLDQVGESAFQVYKTLRNCYEAYIERNPIKVNNTENGQN